MEYGLIPKIDQFSDNKALELQRVQASSNSSEVKTKESLEQVQQQAISKAKEASELKDIKNEQQSSNKYEVVLSNMNFGYNDSSKDFYVKVERGNIENQYPTEEMMKMKAYMLSLNEQISAS
ncbi:hypothetical protein [Arcobacter cloacae]|uniref:FlaG family protein n=1 Tax=Arcobacter cloacae TaxID=1054034 RepID=A0A4Q0ZHN9_9BACT|nr:hypothetical protein [Arcobacter cloacae]RXJ85370.1 hypothetical protein CRU90_01985 [Arcobacter cloacae]